MRSFPSSAVACAALTLVTTLTVPFRAVSQEASSEETARQHRQVLGYQDQTTGVFHPLPDAIPDATIPPVAGTITLTMHITLKTAVPSGDKVACSSQLLSSYSSATTAHTYSESGSVFATVSGSTATCTVAIPYSWQFPAVTTTDVEILSGSYVAEIINPSASFVTQVPVLRSSASSFVSLQGANIFTVTTLSYSVNVTL